MVSSSVAASQGSLQFTCRYIRFSLYSSRALYDGSSVSWTKLDRNYEQNCGTAWDSHQKLVARRLQNGFNDKYCFCYRKTTTSPRRRKSSSLTSSRTRLLRQFSCCSPWCASAPEKDPRLHSKYPLIQNSEAWILFEHSSGWRKTARYQILDQIFILWKKYHLNPKQSASRKQQGNGNEEKLDQIRLFLRLLLPSI